MAGQLQGTFVFYYVICTVGYVCSFLRDQIFVDFVSFKFLSMIIYDVQGIIPVFAASGF